MYFNSKGYLNCGKMIDESHTFLAVLGGRGVGKTYGFIKELFHRRKKFIYLRTNEKQAEKARSLIYSPLLHIAGNEGFNVELESDEGIGNIMLDGELFGHVMALSTVQNIRGFDAPHVEVILYDEFIRQKTERRTIKDEYDALRNMYETIARNRELEGREPVKMILLGNYNVTNSDILRGMDLFPLIDESVTSGEMVHRGVISLLAVQDSPVSLEKSKTALYQLPDPDGEFSRMAIENNSPLTIKPRKVPMTEYKPFFVWADHVMIYRHKSIPRFHATAIISGYCPNVHVGSRKMLSPGHRRLIAAVAIALTKNFVTVSDIKAAAELHNLIGIDN